MKIPLPEELTPTLQPILAVIRAAIVHGIKRSREYFEQEGQQPDRDLAPEIVRYHAKRYLDNAGHAVHALDADYERPPVNKNGLRMVWKDFRILIRKSDDGELPVPGSNALVEFYSHNATFGFMTLEGPTIHVVVLWDTDRWYSDLVAFQLALPSSGGLTRDLTSAFWYAPIALDAATEPDNDDLPYELKDDEQHQSGAE
jgi:hypothetical protein